MDILEPAVLLVHPMQLQLYQLAVVHLGREERLEEGMKDKIPEALMDNYLEEHHT